MVRIAVTVLIEMKRQFFLLSCLVCITSISWTVPNIVPEKLPITEIPLASAAQAELMGLRWDDCRYLKVANVSTLKSERFVEDADSTISRKTNTASLNSTDLIFLGLALIPLDAKLMPELQRSIIPEHDNDLIALFNSMGTPQLLLPVIGIGYLSDNKYDRDTAKMAAVALLNAGVLAQAGKMLAGRARPGVDSAHLGEFTGPFPASGYESMPSGHTALAFAAAVVVGERYPKRRTICYLLASAVGVARILSSDHFPSDVLVGAGVGMFAGKSSLSSHGQLLHFSW